MILWSLKLKIFQAYLQSSWVLDKNVNTSGLKAHQTNIRTPNISSLTRSLIYSLLMSYCYYDRDTQNRGVNCHVLMNNNNPNLNAKYEEAYKIEQTPDLSTGRKTTVTRPLCHAWEGKSSTRLEECTRELQGKSPWISVYLYLGWFPLTPCTSHLAPRCIRRHIALAVNLRGHRWAMTRWLDSSWLLISWGW